ncbi:MAG: SsrA-binding protein SmpB [Phycisphaerales bacterium]
MARKPPKQDPTIENRRARFDYAISDTLEVGMVLAGPEVKSVRDGRVSLAEGYIRVQEDPLALYLHSVNIDEYGPAAGGPDRPAMARTRKLLAHRREILKLARQVEQKGMTILPLKLYFKNGFAKLLIGLGKGRSRFDKRQTISARESKRDVDRAMSRKR